MQLRKDFIVKNTNLIRLKWLLEENQQKRKLRRRKRELNEKQREGLRKNENSFKRDSRNISRFIALKRYFSIFYKLFKEYPIRVV